MDTTDLKKYELMLIVSGELTEAQFEKELAEIRKLLKETSQDISYEETWGRRDLAFKIKKQTNGYYTFFNFSAAPEAIAELRVNVKLNPVVLRHLLLALPEGYVPGKYNEVTLRDEKPKEVKRKPGTLSHELGKPAMVKPVEMKEPVKVSGKTEEEQLAKVEKRLEKILENPDIDIR